ncbi:AGRG6-like protein, partial [Mya arenaria]
MMFHLWPANMNKEDKTQRAMLHFVGLAVLLCGVVESINICSMRNGSTTDCQIGGKVYNCSYQRLTTVPFIGPGADKEVCFLDLSHNQLVEVNDEMFNFLPNLRLLDLRWNRIKHVSRYAFFTLPMLSTVNNLRVRYGRDLQIDGFCADGSFQCSEDIVQASATCYTCQQVETISQCLQKQQCANEKGVCFSEMEYNGQSLTFSAGCKDYENCMTDLHLTCTDSSAGKGGTLSANCRFCYKGSLSNNIVVPNFISKYTIGGKITLSAKVMPRTENYTAELRNLVSQAPGDIEVGQLEFRNDGLLLTFRMYVTTVYFETLAHVLNGIANEMRINIQSISFNALVENGSAEPVHCPEISEDTPRGLFVWPVTITGNEITVTCPINAKENATRNNYKAEWESAAISKCLFKDSFARKLEEMDNVFVTDENVQELVKNLSSASNNWTTYHEHHVDITVNVLENVMNYATTGLSTAVSEDLVSVISNVMNVNDSILSKAQSTGKTSQRSRNKFQSVKQNVAVVALTDADNETKGYTLSFKSNSSDLTDSGVNVVVGEADVDNGNSGITVPGNASTRRNITISILNNEKLFTSQERRHNVNKTGKKAKHRHINSRVIGARVPGFNVSNLTTPVRITLQHRKKGGNVTCVYWSEKQHLWKTDGCSVHKTNADYTVCHCEHLTNFALLMDIHNTGETLSDTERKVLKMLSQIGCGLSFVGATLTSITHFMMYYSKDRLFKQFKDRSSAGQTSVTVAYLCGAISVIDLVFVIGNFGFAEEPRFCKAIAVVLHFAFLSVFLFMGVMSGLLIYKLVRPFKAQGEVGLPILVIAVAMCVNISEIYGYQPSGMCWISRLTFQATVIPVVSIILSENICAVLLYLHVRNKMRKKMNSANIEMHKWKQVTDIMLNAVKMAFLLGIPFGFAFFAIGDAAFVVQILFVLFNTLQGVFIFIFFWIKDKNAPKYCKHTLLCFKSPYEQRQSQQASEDVSELATAKPSTFASTANNSVEPVRVPDSAVEKVEDDVPKATEVVGNFKGK